MSNILPEDVKLMAEFDGYGPISVLEGKYFACKDGVRGLIPVPNYPKDMNALLGVITEAVNRGVLSEGDGDELLADSVLKCHGIYTDLPAVLFPLLIEAIKQINKCTDNPVGRKVRVTSDGICHGKLAVCLAGINGDGRHELAFGNSFVGWYLREQFEIIPLEQIKESEMVEESHYRVCNNDECMWEGMSTDLVRLGDIQDLCPACGETTEPQQCS